MIDLNPGHCTCGCGEPVAANFKQGHDSRLKATLRAAHATGEQLPIKGGPDRRRKLTALEIAGLLDHPRHSWSAAIAGGAK